MMKPSVGELSGGGSTWACAVVLTRWPETRPKLFERSEFFGRGHLVKTTGSRATPDRMTGETSTRQLPHRRRPRVVMPRPLYKLKPISPSLTFINTHSRYGNLAALPHYFLSQHYDRPKR